MKNGSAKVTGRPIFNKMIERIEHGDANGILAWHPDRLARNSVDGGKIIYLLDGGGLADLKFPQFWCENTSQGKFMLNIAFGQSKYYVDSLAENTKRGLRQKVRRGEYPGLAPVGYINDVRTKSIVVDKKRSVIIRKAFTLYAKMEVVLKTSQTFWRNPVSILGTASDSTETELLLSFPIRFTMDTFAMAAKSTRASTSQSSQRKFLTRRRKY